MGRSSFALRRVSVTIYMRMFRSVYPVLLILATPMALPAQSTVPPNSPQATQFKDTSMLKPPAGAKVAVIEYEDLECPACAHAFPIVHTAVNHYHVAMEEYDFQIPGHAWSHDAAIFSHYLKATVSPELAEEFRREVFASQMRIASKDDLHNFEQSFMSQHGKQIPFVVDPTGEYDREVNASTNQGMKLGLNHTPTIVVVTPTHWTEVADVSDIDQAIEQAEAEAAHTSSAPAHRTVAHK